MRQPQPVLPGPSAPTPQALEPWSQRAPMSVGSSEVAPAAAEATPAKQATAPPSQSRGGGGGRQGQVSPPQAAQESCRRAGLVSGRAGQATTTATATTATTAAVSESARLPPTLLDHTEPFSFTIVGLRGNLCFRIKETDSTAYHSWAPWTPSRDAVCPRSHPPPPQCAGHPPCAAVWAGVSGLGCSNAVGAPSCPSWAATL